MATHSSILDWEITWTEGPGRLQSMGLQRVGHDLLTKEQKNHPHNQGAELIKVVTTRISLVLPLDIHTQPLPTSPIASPWQPRCCSPPIWFCYSKNII